MSNQKDTQPKFKDDHDALVFLIEKYHFEGGWIGAGGMGPEGKIEIEATAPEWAKKIGWDFVFNLHCEVHPVLDMAMEVVHCTYRRKDSKLLLTRYWSSPIVCKGPCVLQPRALQEAIISILGIKSFDSGDDVEDWALSWTKDSETGRFIPDTEDFVLFDGEFNDITCNKKQALKILAALRKPGMTEDKYWSSFKSIDSIHLAFSNLDGDHQYCITGQTKPEDITAFLLKSKENCRPRCSNSSTEGPG